MNPKISFLVVLVFLVGAGVLIMLGNPSDQAGLSGVMEMAGDAQRGVLKPAMVATRLSTQEEMELGRRLAGRIGSDVPRSGGLREMEAYIVSLGSHVAQSAKRDGITYTFHLLDYDTINAFALPGGQIFVYRGLVEFLESEAELAAILGHEITHVDARHCVELFQAEIAARKVTEPLFGRASFLFELGAGFISRVVTAGYSKYLEFQADAEGVRLAADAGFDPDAAGNVFRRMGDRFGGESRPRKAPDPVGELAKAVLVAAGSYFHSHPPFRERIDKLRPVQETLKTPGSLFYQGRRNLRERKTRWAMSLPEEEIRP